MLFGSSDGRGHQAADNPATVFRATNPPLALLWTSAVLDAIKNIRDLMKKIPLVGKRRTHFAELLAEGMS